MRYGNDDQAGQADIERDRIARRRRVQLGIMSPSSLVATYRRVCRQNPGHVKASAGVPQDRQEMIAAIMTIEQARDDDQ